MSTAPAALSSLRAAMADAGVEAYLGVKREHMRWLTGFTLAEGEEKVAGHSGQFLVGGDEVIVVTDSRYTLQAGREATEAVVDEIGYELPAAWPRLLARVGARRVAVEAAGVSHALWQRLAAAAPDVELVPVEGWIEAMRATKTPDEVERIAAACAVADRALAALLPEIRPGVTEHDLALRLEWLIRTGGAEALAFDVACLAGPEAALPHGSPGDRPVLAGAVLLFDFGAQVEGYRSDMTRTLFVGEPVGRGPRAVRAGGGGRSRLDRCHRGVRGPGARPRLDDLISGRGRRRRRPGRDRGGGPRRALRARDVGHGIGLATHEEPRLSRLGPETPLPSPTVFSVEPGVYLEGETGIRIEDLVHLDVSRGLVERLTRFPRDVVALPG